MEGFLREFPGWLVNLHFERLSHALSTKQLLVARSHWQLLEGAAQLPVLQQTADLELLRDRLCQRFLPEALLPVGLHERQEVIHIAERLLHVDPDNASARIFVLKGYAFGLERGLEGLAYKRPRKDNLLPSQELTSRAARHISSRLRRDARRLRRHATVLSRTAQRSQPEVVDGFLTLCRYYWGINEREIAMRMARRARQLNPVNPHLRQLMRQLRRLRRS
jgi:hypothetical protein